MTTATTLITDDIEIRAGSDAAADAAVASVADFARREALEKALEQLRKDQEFRNSPAEVAASIALMHSLEPYLIRIHRYCLIGERVLYGLFARKMDEDRGFELMLPDGPFKRLKAYHPAYLPTMINGLLLLFGGAVDHRLHNRYWALSNIPPWERTLWA